MKYVVTKGICLMGGALMMLGALADAEEKSVEEKTKIHRLTNTQRSVFDAFTYVNRIPEEADTDETPMELTGRIIGRLGNQEGRILLKLPPGMDRDSYLAFKAFIRYDGDAAGNCAACHAPRTFTDGKEHVVTKGGPPVATPSLRNLKERDIDVAKAIRAKIAAGNQKRSGEADEIDDAFALITLSEKDIPGLVSFLSLLNDTPESGFRDLILKAELLENTQGLQPTR